MVGFQPPLVRIKICCEPEVSLCVVLECEVGARGKEAGLPLEGVLASQCAWLLPVRTVLVNCFLRVCLTLQRSVKVGLGSSIIFSCAFDQMSPRPADGIHLCGEKDGGGRNLDHSISFVLIYLL